MIQSNIVSHLCPFFLFKLKIRKKTCFKGRGNNSDMSRDDRTTNCISDGNYNGNSKQWRCTAIVIHFRLECFGLLTVDLRVFIFGAAVLFLILNQPMQKPRPLPLLSSLYWLCHQYWLPYSSLYYLLFL